jgi:hypothetical protein
VTELLVIGEVFGRQDLFGDSTSVIIIISLIDDYFGALEFFAVANDTGKRRYPKRTK